MRAALCLLLALAAPVGAVGQEWRSGAALYRFDTQLRTVTAEIRGTRFAVAAGVGPRFLAAGRETDGSAVLERQEQRGDTLHCTYRVLGLNDPRQFSLDVSPGAGALVVRVMSASRQCARVSTGTTSGLARWARVSFTRQAEPYGQGWWPRVAWAPDEGVAVSALWDMASSNGTAWDAPDKRFAGTGEFAAGLDVLYSPNSLGQRMPVDETLTLRVAAKLWDAAPPPGNPPSEYRRDLAGQVFLDVWGGTARETTSFLRHLSAITRARARFLTIFENWQAGGFDSLLPDSILMPDYPPNPGIGSIGDFAALSRTARTMGRFGLRTNYVYLRDASPSVKAGRARVAIGEDGKPKWHTRPADWLALAARQEREIRALFSTDASLTDQLTSAGSPWGYTDWDGTQLNGTAMRTTLATMRRFADLIRGTHRGPLGSETLIDETMLGAWVDTGDFGIFDGYHRAFTPEFKLRRLQALTAYHGMGLMYRYFEMPPFKAFSTGTANYLADPAQYDDYRAAEVLYGNGGYLFYYPGMPWDYVLTESLVVGSLQKRYALQPVGRVLYWDAGAWVILERLLDKGIDPWPVPWDPQPDALKRIRVEYANGLTVLVNRLDDPFAVDAGGMQVTLPKSGWAAWARDGFVALSAVPAGQTDRIDFVRDPAAGLLFVNPRTAVAVRPRLAVHARAMASARSDSWRRAKLPALWLGGKLASMTDPATGDAWVAGAYRRFTAPTAPRLKRIDFNFDREAQGWTGMSCLGPLRSIGGVLTADIVGEDPYMQAPPIDLAPDSVKAIVIRVRVSCGTFGQLYFQAEGASATAEEMCIHFPVTAGQWQEVRVAVGEHPLWRGRRITSLRLDPEHGATPGTMEIDWIRSR